MKMNMIPVENNIGEEAQAMADKVIANLLRGVEEDMMEELGSMPRGLQVAMIAKCLAGLADMAFALAGLLLREVDRRKEQKEVTSFSA